MRRSWAALTVGALTVVVLIVGFTIFRYTSDRLGGGEGYEVYALFNDAMGLSKKSAVRSAGIRVGQIEEIGLHESGKAKVVIRIDPDVAIWSNHLVSKRVASLLGEVYLDIAPGGPVSVVNGVRTENRRIKEGDELKNVLESATTTQIIDQVNNILPLVREILQDVRGLTSGQVKEIADNLNKMVSTNSAKLEQLIGRIDNIAASVERVTTSEEEDIKVSLRNVREISEGIKQLVGTTQGEVGQTGEKLRSSVDRLQNSIASLERSMTNVEKITGRVAEGEGTVGKLVNDPDIAENIEQITEDASGLVRGLTRLQTIVGLRSEYNYIAQTFKSYFQVYLMPRPDKFYLVEIVDDPRGYRRQSTRHVDSGKDGTYSETIVETSQQLRLSFMFGKRLGPITGRFGIKESTGGIGLDLHLLDDRLTLSADVFDGRSNRYPRFQARAILNVYKRYISLVGGVDDVFNYTPTLAGAGGFFDWFLGAQLQFNDEDLRQLLLFGSSALGSAANQR